MDWKRIQYATPAQIKALQDKKLRAFVRYQLPYSPYYRAVFERHGLKFSDIKSTDDLQKLPFTTKADIAPTEDNPARPRDIVLQPTEELLRTHAPSSLKLRLLLGMTKRADIEEEYKPIHIHFTTGRTALPTPFVYTPRDLVALRAAGLRMMDVLGVTGDNITVNAFPYAPHLAFWQSSLGLMEARILSLNTGGGKILGTKRIIDSVKALKATVLIGMPGYVYYLLNSALEQGVNLPTLRTIILGGERVPPGLRVKLKDILIGMGANNPKVLSTYAFTEGKVAWVQCGERSGYHLYPDLEYIEIVDKNGEPVAPGERGEIVYSALDWRGSVVLRYKTGDIGALEPELPCPSCGRTVPRIVSDIERSSETKEIQLTKVKGTLINLNTFFSLFMAHPDVKEWQVEIRKRKGDPYSLDELVIYVAPRAGADFTRLKRELGGLIREQMEIEPTDIVKMSEAELRERLGIEKELKEKRIVDIRPK